MSSKPARLVSLKKAERTPAAPPDLLAAFFELIQWVVRDTLRTNTSREADEWIDQARSPLGRRQHLALVRRGILSGCKVGRRVLVRRAEIDEYVERHKIQARKVQVRGDGIDRELEALGFGRRAG